MALSAGNRIGPYEIVSALGVGGMGEVYRARDPRLGREVAIKVLPEAMALDAERLARFEREARLLAALSHAGIASIYGVEDAGGTRALVMELVEGSTLAARIEQGPLDPDEALPVARQMADALEYAHECGIVHRDLKPANVKLRPDGTVKVLDFGLARALATEAGASAADISHSPTITGRMTQAGVILGTAAYMSPEQARGREADRRADIWSFGTVLYEMLSGRRPFAGETMSEMLAAVMRDEPDWSALPPELSPRWRRLLERCLAKDPRRRLQAIGEARIVLEDLAANPEDPPPEQGAAAEPSPARRTALIAWIFAAVAAVTAIGLAVTLWRIPPPASSVTELSIVPAGEQQVGMDLGYHPMAIAPDGRSIAYTTRVGSVLKLRLRGLDTREDKEIAGTDGARNLFFSRDGQWIGFFDSRKLYRVSVRGGTPVELADAGQDRLGTWLDDGTIVYTRETTEPLYRIPESGGAPVAVTTLDTTKRERTHRFPSALDGGPWVVFTAQTVDSPGGYDDASIDAVSVKTGERRHLYKGARRAVWVPGGYLILARGSDLYAAPIDPRDPRLTTDPVPVLAGVSGDTSSGASYFSIANDGSIAWLPGGEPEQTRDAAWFDRSGRSTPTSLPAGPYLGFRISPDGLRTLVQSGPGGGSSDLWLADLRTGAINRLTHGSRSGLGVWFPDGVRIAYPRGHSEGGDAVVVRRLDGAGGEREIARASNPIFVSGVTPDGRAVIYGDFGKRDGRLYLASAQGGAAPRELAAEGVGAEMAGTVSPDGRWLAYVTNKTRREEVCLRRLDGTGASWQLSNNQAGGIRWGRGGREIFFVSAEQLVRVPLTVQGEDLSIGQPELLFDVPPTPLESTFRDYDYDLVNDRFLFTRPPRELGKRREIAVSLGWAKRLASRVGKERSGR